MQIRWLGGNSTKIPFLSYFAPHGNNNTFRPNIQGNLLPNFSQPIVQQGSISHNRGVRPFGRQENQTSRFTDHQCPTCIKHHKG